VEIRAEAIVAMMRPAQTKGRTSGRRLAAFTLVELLLAMTIMSLLLGLVAVFLRGMFEVEANARRQIAISDSLARLSRALRDDAHAALTADKAGAVLELRLAPEKVVRYAHHGDEVLREETIDGQFHRRDAYRVPRSCQVAFDLLGDARMTLVTLTLAPSATRAGGRRAGGAQATRIEAVLARDHRFQKPETEKD
jgi:type II secretory pathway pseudopilin PulG